MKKIALLFALLLFSFPALGQANNDNTLTFLGIPVDGSKSAMISALRAKGFTYNRTRDVLTGEFNGQNSMVIIHENHGKVDRVYVVNQSGTRSPSQARIQYNTLLHQLNDSEKYISFDENNPIPEDEDISYEMSVNGKAYNATFYLSPLYNNDEMIEVLASEIGKEIFQDYEDGKIEELTEEIFQELSLQRLMMKMYEMTRDGGAVWFSLEKLNGEYHVAIFYDNLKNRPHGEDL